MIFGCFRRGRGRRQRRRARGRSSLCVVCASAEYFHGLTRITLARAHARGRARRGLPWLQAARPPLRRRLHEGRRGVDLDALLGDDGGLRQVGHWLGVREDDGLVAVLCGRRVAGPPCTGQGRTGRAASVAALCCKSFECMSEYAPDTSGSLARTCASMCTTTATVLDVLHVRATGLLHVQGALLRMYCVPGRRRRHGSSDSTRGKLVRRVAAAAGGRRSACRRVSEARVLQFDLGFGPREITVGNRVAMVRTWRNPCATACRNSPALATLPAFTP